MNTNKMTTTTTAKNLMTKENSTAVTSVTLHASLSIVLTASVRKIFANAFDAWTGLHGTSEVSYLIMICFLLSSLIQIFSPQTFSQDWETMPGTDWSANYRKERSDSCCERLLLPSSANRDGNIETHGPWNHSTHCICQQTSLKAEKQ